MSMQKHDEIMDHVVLNLRTVLKIIKDMEDDNRKIKEDVDNKISALIIDSNKTTLPTFGLISKAIDACPTEKNMILLEASNKLVDQVFREREKIALEEFSNDMIRNWIKAYIEARNIVSIEKSQKIYSALENITMMLAGFKKYLELEDDDGGSKKDKPITKKEDLPPKTRVAIGGDD
jgi:hypothetical protein